jgi:iron complex outermembrane receptor protein
MSVKTKRAIWLGSAVIFAFAGFAIIPSTAWADEAPLSGVKVTNGVQVAQSAAPPPPPAAEEEEDKSVERVVVTGSRLRKNEFTSSSPIQVITSEESTLEGLTDTADILHGASVVAGSQQINNTLTGFVGFDGGPGANTVSLRGLGANRTLVLVNGRRMGPAGTRGQILAVDLNTLPESMIDRIEILKDGGSSIYGSDAVAGVVNVILRKNEEGIVLNGSTNVPFEGGGETYQIDGYWGETFDRGQIMVAGEYFHRVELTRGDRDYLSCAQDNVSVFSGPLAGQKLDLIDPATGVSKCFNAQVGLAARGSGGLFVPTPGLVAGGGFLPNTVPAIAGAQPDVADWRRVGHAFASVNTYFNNLCANAVLAALPENAFCGSATTLAAKKEEIWRASQGVNPFDNPKVRDGSVLSPVTRYSLFAQGSYDVMSGMEAYGEAFFTRRESNQHGFRQFFPVIPATHTSNPFGVVSQPVYYHQSNQWQTVDFYRAVAGIRGEFGDRTPIFDGWSYDLVAQHSRSEGDYTRDFIYNDRVLATQGPGCIQAAIFSGGDCATLPAAGINWFAPNAINNGEFTAAEAAFLFDVETGHTTYQQTLLNGSITGDLFQLPAGVVPLAIGFEYREDFLDDTPGVNEQGSNSPVDIPTNFWGSSAAGRTIGSDRVREVFAEVSIPIIGGKSFVENLTLDASTRYTDYDSYGADMTYKLGLNYQITPEYRLRGTTGTSFRAPALYEMFLANQTGFLGQAAIDPCINWNLSSDPLIFATCGSLGLELNYDALPSSSATIITGGGGPGVLSAERSEARTVGFIWTPDWIDFSAAIDYWEFEVNGEVAQFGPRNIVTACHTTPPFGSSPFCSLFQRNLTGDPLTNPNFGNIIFVNDSFVNLDSQISDGLDVTVRYEHEFSFGTFRFDGQATWTFTDEIQVFAAGGALTEFNGEIIDPDFNANLNFRFDHEDWTFFWATDLVSRASNDEEFGGSVFSWRGFTPVNGNVKYKQYAEFYANHDASVRYRADDWSITLGVQNLFDEPPPFISANSGFGRIGNAVAVTGQYDLLGRRGFLTVAKEF